LLTGFEKIVEKRIKDAQDNGDFKNLPGAGKPIIYDDRQVPEELRLAYKILKNADSLPPELELKKEIRQTEELLAGMGETEEKYRIIKKLNFLIMKFNSIRGTSVIFEKPQQYYPKLLENISSKHSSCNND